VNGTGVYSGGRLWCLGTLKLWFLVSACTQTMSTIKKRLMKTASYSLARPFGLQQLAYVASNEIGMWIQKKKPRRNGSDSAQVYALATKENQNSWYSRIHEDTQANCLAQWHGCWSLVECCQIEVSASGWLVVHKSPTECGVSECDHDEEALAHWGCCVMVKKKSKRQRITQLISNKLIMWIRIT
jgi:hypothetical protein